MADNILDIQTLGNVTINLDAGTFTGGGGLTPEGFYPFTVVKLGVTANKDGSQSLAVNLKFDGIEREVYDYVALPHPGHEHAKIKDREFNTFLMALGVVQESATGAIAVNGTQLGAAIINKRGGCYYIPPEMDASNKIIKNTDQIDYIVPSQVEAVKSGERKIVRRKSAAKNNSLGSTTGAQSGQQQSVTVATPPALGALGGGINPLAGGLGGGLGGPVPTTAGPSLGGLPGLGL